MSMELCGVLYVTLVVLFMIHVLLSLQYKWTPLMWASSKGHVTCVQLLLEKGAEIDHQDQVSVV